MKLYTGIAAIMMRILGYAEKITDKQGAVYSVNKTSLLNHRPKAVSTFSEQEIRTLIKTGQFKKKSDNVVIPGNSKPEDDPSKSLFNISPKTTRRDTYFFG